MSEVKFKYYANVTEKQVDWLWYPYIPYGKLTLIQGDPGEGKSTFILNVVSLLTTGKPMPDGYESHTVGNVIYQCSEDGAEDTVKPRLMAAGADCSKVAYIMEDGKALTLDDNRIEEAIKKMDARLVILDPLQSFVPQDGDLHSSSRMRHLLGNLASTAEKYNCAIVLIGHMNKSQSGKNLYRGLGSIDISAIARSVLMVERDEENSNVRYMFPIKSSLAPEGCAIGFRFDRKRGFQWIGKCEYKHYEVEEEKTETKIEVAVRMLLSLLRKEDLLSNQVLRYMSDLGISERTVHSAKKQLGVVSYKRQNKWYWSLPKIEDLLETEDADGRED